MTRIIPAALDAFADGLKRKERAMEAPKYDLKAMGYGQYLLPDAFVWSASPQGYAFWNDHFFNQPSDEGRAARAAKEQS